jgi:hypothetical protein
VRFAFAPLSGRGVHSECLESRLHVLQETCPWRSDLRHPFQRRLIERVSAVARQGAARAESENVVRNGHCLIDNTDRWTNLYRQKTQTRSTAISWSIWIRIRKPESVRLVQVSVSLFSRASIRGCAKENKEDRLRCSIWTRVFKAGTDVHNEIAQVTRIGLSIHCQW